MTIKNKLDEAGVELSADVLVIGGGPAAAWAALAAAERGARVIAADKGYFGASGAFAASTSGAKVIPPIKELRDPVKFERYALGGHLAQHSWWDRLLDVTYEKAPKIYDWGGYEMPCFDGKPAYRGLQGSETMRIMRRQVRKAGVQILDQSPALELLVDQEGSVAGARGYQRQEGRTWTVKANAVVLASGGCAWLSKALGTNTNTGDGLLMAVEAGGELSSMEFAAHYVPAPKHSSVTKSAYYRYASFYDKDGKVLDGLTRNGHRSTSAIAKELLKGPVFVTLNQHGADNPDMQELLRLQQPNFMNAFDKAGINPFTDKWEITLLLEGTVRGVGGVRIAGKGCETTVDGLYAAGDAATRELNCGGFTGGAGPNMTWAIGSGNIAGWAAADFAKGVARNAADRKSRGAGRAGLVATRETADFFDAESVVKGVQDEIFPIEKNIFRSEKTLIESMAKLNQLWAQVQANPDQGDARKLIRSREAVSLLAAARWTYFAGLERKETRGMHKRMDFPQTDPAQRHYLSVGGLDRLWTRQVEVPEEVVPAPSAKEAVHA